MPTVTYVIDHRTAADEPHKTILRASLRAGVPHAHACGGNARCSTCRVRVVDGTRGVRASERRERELAERLRFAPEVRLACQTTVVRAT